MNLAKKLEIVEQSIASISSHTDEDAAVRAATLERVITIANAHLEAIEAETKAAIEATLGAKG